MNISGLLQSYREAPSSWNHEYLGPLQSKWSPKGFTLTLQETPSIHDSMNLRKNELIAYIFILL